MSRSDVDLQVWLAKCLPLDEEVALKILEADDLKCPLVSRSHRVASLKRFSKGTWCLKNESDFPVVFTGAHHARDADNARDAAPECHASLLLLCAQGAAVDGHALCGRRLPVRHHLWQLPSGKSAGVPFYELSSVLLSKGQSI